MSYFELIGAKMSASEKEQPVFDILAFPNVGWIIELQGTEEAKPEPNLSPRNLGKVFIPYPTPVQM